jgi:hypothetical protein
VIHLGVVELCDRVVSRHNGIVVVTDPAIPA